MNESHMHVCFRAAQTFCSLSPQAQAVFVTVARSGADCQMDGGNDGDAKRRTGRDSEKDDAAARVDPSKVKKEKLSGAGERGVPKRRAEEGIQLTAAVAASQKGAVADKAVRPGTEKPRDADAESDSYSDSSDHSVTLARRARSPWSSGEHYELDHWWSGSEEDGGRRGHKA